MKAVIVGIVGLVCAAAIAVLSWAGSVIWSTRSEHRALVRRQRRHEAPEHGAETLQNAGVESEPDTLRSA